MQCDKSEKKCDVSKGCECSDDTLMCHLNVNPTILKHITGKEKLSSKMLKDMTSLVKIYYDIELKYKHIENSEERFEKTASTFYKKLIKSTKHKEIKALFFYLSFIIMANKGNMDDFVEFILYKKVKEK